MIEPVMESGMAFGPFDENDFFYIEKSKMLRKTQGIRTVEFVIRPKKNMLYFIEAKSSAPVDPDVFAKEISEKFIDSFELLMAGLNKRKPGREEIGDRIQKTDMEKTNYIFFLIINGHKEDWLPKIKAFIDENMKHFQAIWNCNVLVLNDAMAREQHLIQ